MRIMRKTAVSALLAFAIGGNMVDAMALDSTNSVFSMYQPDGVLISAEVDTSVHASWDGEAGAGHMTISSTDSFYGLLWTAHDITVYGPGTHSVATGQAERPTLTFTVPAGHYAGHMLFDWGATIDIDVVNVWSVSGADLTSTDVICNYSFDAVTVSYTLLDPLATDGILGHPMVDGPFPGFNANFNLLGVVPDTTAPVITLTGSTNLVLLPCAGYAEGGYTASDDRDGDLTGDVVVTGANFDDCVEGTYTISYNVSDAAGNPATTKTRTITVVDKPIVTVNSPGDLIVLQGESFTDPGATCVDSDGSALEVEVGGDTVNTANLGSYTITYDCTNGLQDADQQSRTVTVVDDPPPVLALTGQATVTLECGGSYTDAGATCEDTPDGTLSVVDDASQLDTGSVGSYTVSYSCTDSSFYSATASRTVNVVDTTAPSISLLGEASVKVSTGDTYTDAGAACSDSCEGSLTVSSANPVDTSVEGTYTVTYTCVDTAGNAAASVTRTVEVGGCELSGSPLINNFTMLDPDGNRVGGANNVEFTWDGTLNDDPATAVANATLETACPFFGIGWKADPVYFYGPGEYTFETCLDDGSSKCTAPAPITMTVDAGQVGAHMLFTWGVAVNIDMVNVFDQGKVFGGPLADNCYGVDVNTVWDLTSTDDDDDGIMGVPFVDGPFKDFSGNMNLMLPDTENTTLPQQLPVLEIQGDNPLMVAKNAAFTCPEAVAVDLKDGQLCDNVTVSGCEDVDTSKPGHYTVSYEVVDSNGNVVTDDLDVVVMGAAADVSGDGSTSVVVVFNVDPNGPAACLLGEAVINLTQGDDYTDPGAYGLDLQDGELQATITRIVHIDAHGVETVVTAVDTSVPGTYIVTFTVTDSGGNPTAGVQSAAADSLSTEITRTVQVNAVPNYDSYLPAEPDEKSDVGCSATDKPVNPLSRVDLALVAGFLAWFGIRRVKRSDV